MTALGENGPVAVIGAGQAGAMLALYLARLGQQVDLYESRPDLRREEVDAGRSINLALATRGLVALEELGLTSLVDEIAVPMAGRMVHVDGVQSFQPYGSRPEEVIHSVSRQDLNAILLDAAEAAGVRIHFSHWCQAVDFERNIFTVGPYGAEVGEGTRDVAFGTVFGCDGSGSEVRDDVIKASGGSLSAQPLDHGYKELSIPATDDGGFRLNPHALHIWPRGELMLIALANPEGDFTATLFMPHVTADPDGPVGFDDLTTPEQVDAFFQREFPDFVALVPDLVEQFFENPIGDLATIRAKGWSVGDRAVLVGDAAHAIVPFHGQGMNLAMESCRLLNRALRQSPADVAAAFRAFEADRKPDADAIADMALDNYVEMRADVVDPGYLLRRELALELERRHPDRVAPRYGMVMFTTMPYAEVQERNRRQQEIFAELTAGASSLDDVDFARAAALVEQLGPLPEWI